MYLISVEKIAWLMSVMGSWAKKVLVRNTFDIYHCSESLWNSSKGGHISFINTKLCLHI